MVRVRLGSTWKQDPSVRAALARGGPGARAAAHAAVDAVALEVDGIDLVSGRAEGPLLDSVEALGEAVLRLLAGAHRAEVHFSDGELEVVLGRRGASAVLTAVSVGRPARVLARDVEVDLAELARATAQAAAALASDLGTLQAVAAPAATRSLLRLAGRLEAARLEPVAAPPPPRHGPEHRPGERPGAPACTFELHDDDELIASYRGPGADLGALLPPGRVVLRAPDGREALVLEGPPFLVLRDLVAFASRVADAVRRGEAAVQATLAAPGRHATVELEEDLEAGTLARRGARPLPCPPLPLARALCEAAVDLCGVFVARNPWQAHNGWLAELRAAAAGALAHVHELIAGDVLAARTTPVRRRGGPRLPRSPLGPGRMRRLSFRRTWEAEVGTPAGVGLALAGDLLVAAGAGAVLGLDPLRGDERWRRPGVALAVACDGALYLADAAGLAALDPATGRERWRVPAALLPDGGVRRVLRAAGGVTVALGRGAATAVGPAGRVAWSIAPPAAHALRAAALGPLVAVATDAGFLYGIDAASGETRWRLRLPGPVTADPTGLGDGCLVACVTDLGGSLVALEAATGRRRFEVPLDVTPTGGPVPFAGLLAVAGTVAGDPMVAAVDPAGRLAWEDAPPLGAGAVALAPLPAALLAKTAHGACVALDRSGDAAWSRPAHAAPAPRNVVPVVARGVALVPSEAVEALDARTGELLGSLPLAAPVRLVTDARLHAWGVDAAGVVTAVRLETHLSVV